MPSLSVIVNILDAAVNLKMGKGHQIWYQQVWAKLSFILAQSSKDVIWQQMENTPFSFGKKNNNAHNFFGA